MVNPSEWAQWYYLIYLLPGGLALLLLSALGGGMRHGNHIGHSHQAGNSCGSVSGRAGAGGQEAAGESHFREQPGTIERQKRKSLYAKAVFLCSCFSRAPASPSRRWR